MVRASAAEIRKKLAQYYQEEGHAATRIEQVISIGYRLSATVHHFDAVDACHSGDRYETEVDLSLSVGTNRGEGSFNRTPFATRRFEYVELTQQCGAVAVHVEEAAADPADADIAGPIVTLAES